MMVGENISRKSFPFPATISAAKTVWLLVTKPFFGKAFSAHLFREIF